MANEISVYVSGPYTQGDPVVNTRRAFDAADRLRDLGFRPYCPHQSLFAHFLVERTWDQWLDEDKYWVRKCDILLRLPGPSAGGDMEVEEARKHGIPVVSSIEEVCDLLFAPEEELADHPERYRNL